MKIELTRTQVNHLLTLLRDTEDEGAYYGNKEQYWTRHNAIFDALSNAALSESKEKK